MTDEVSTDGEGADASLPTLAGIAVGAASTPAGKALLSPAAEVFGRYFGERAEEITARWRQQRRANAERMRKRVLEKEGPAIERVASEKQSKILIDWFEQGSDVGEEEAEISSVWEGILEEIYKNSPFSEDLIKASKTLNSRDIEILRKVNFRSSRWDSRDGKSFQKLADAG